jgi:transposase
MLINYPYKFRLKPTKEQEKKLFHFAHTSKFVYNLAVDQRNLAKSTSFFSGLTSLLNPPWQIILKLRSSMLPVDIVKYW